MGAIPAEEAEERQAQGLGIAGSIERAKAEKRRLEVTTIRLPPEVIEEVDRQVEAGGWGSRSNLIRHLVIVSLAVGSPEAMSVQQAMDQILGPLIPKIGGLLKQIVAIIPENLLRELVVAVVEAMSPYFIRTLGVPGEFIQDAIFEAIGSIGEDRANDAEVE